MALAQGQNGQPAAETTMSSATATASASATAESHKSAESPDFVSIKLTPPQSKFFLTWNNEPDWALAFVAGFGSGKTFTLDFVAIHQALTYQWANIAIYSPTYDLIKLNNLPRIQEIFDNLKIRHKLNKQDFTISILDSPYQNKIIFRSMDNPERIIAYEVFCSLIDELDTMPSKRAEDAWNKIISRNRQQPPHTRPPLIPKNTLVKIKTSAISGTALDADTTSAPAEKLYRLKSDTFYDPNTFNLINKVGVFTTPEGFKFTYKKWQKEVTPGYRLIRASTYSNPHIPEAYIENLKASYPPQLIEAYLNGEFVNLTGGRVYHVFDRQEHHCSISDIIAPTLALAQQDNVIAI